MSLINHPNVLFSRTDIGYTGWQMKTDIAISNCFRFRFDTCIIKISVFVSFSK